VLTNLLPHVESGVAPQLAVVSDSRGRASPRGQRGLRTANDRDVCVQRPLHDEVVSTGDTQRGAYGAVAPFDFANDLRGVTNHLRLDVRVLVGKIDQDHVAELKPLSVDLNRHPARV
jgi:hypothetical protein